MKYNTAALDEHEKTPSCYAVNLGHWEIVQMLVAMGSTVTASEIDQTDQEHHGSALHRAAECGGLNVVKALVSLKANITKQDKHGKTRLYYVVKYGHGKIVRILVEKGAFLKTTELDETDAENHQTALHRAADCGDAELICDVIDLQANASLIDKYGNTALHIAARNGHKSILTMLIHAGASF